MNNKNKKHIAIQVGQLHARGGLQERAALEVLAHDAAELERHAVARRELHVGHRLRHLGRHSGRARETRGEQFAQGIEAGGHRGSFISTDLSEQCGTMALVPQIVDAVGIPVVAAGGIGDARGVAAALALGASAAQLGTVFLFCHEARLPPNCIV